VLLIMIRRIGGCSGLAGCSSLISLSLEQEHTRLSAQEIESVTGVSKALGDRKTVAGALSPLWRESVRRRPLRIQDGARRLTGFAQVTDLRVDRSGVPSQRRPVVADGFAKQRRRRDRPSVIES
jgi:hypothetical protein